MGSRRGAHELLQGSRDRRRLLWGSGGDERFAEDLSSRQVAIVPESRVG
jgi:hypothetical protein